mgnify:CR=1 FL=1
MNMVAMIGNVATDPVVEHTPSGKAICTFRLAVSRPGGEQADFFTVAAFDRQGEVCAAYLQTGRRIGVEGRLHHSSFETADGESRSRVEIVASRVQFLGANSARAAAEFGEVSA